MRIESYCLDYAHMPKYRDTQPGVVRDEMETPASGTRKYRSQVLNNRFGRSAVNCPSVEYSLSGFPTAHGRGSVTNPIRIMPALAASDITLATSS